MMNKWFNWFESRLQLYPNELPPLSRDNMWAFIRACLKGCGLWIGVMMVFAAGVGAFEAYLFQMMGQLVDAMHTLSPAQLWAEKKGWLMAMLAVLVLSPFWVLTGSSVRLQSLQGVVPMRLRWQFHRLMLGQSMRFYQDEFAGRVSAKVMQTALAVRDMVMIFADMVVYLLIYFVSIGVILAQFDWRLVLPFVLWLFTFASMLAYFVPKMAAAARNQADARSMMTGRITDAYANIATVKLFSHNQRESSYAKEAMDEFMATVHKQMRLGTQIDAVNHSFNMLLIALTAILCVYLWQGGLVSVGAVAAATAMALRLNGLSQWMMWQSAQLFENIGTVQDGMNTLAKDRQVLDVPNAPALQVSHANIAYHNVDFAYEHKQLLKQFNLNIRGGEKIGLVGRSGAGKSTLVNLLLRLYDINGGDISIDGQNIAQVSQVSLRQHIGMVTQDTSLLHRSVRDNILYGRPDASEADLQAALKQAQVCDFLDQLVDAQGRRGLDAHVGERGVKLSGGQRQRIAIARVILKNAPILLLDEATSALDSEVEAAIQENLYSLMENKTVIAIAHRLSTIAQMDRLIVLNEGEIVESGSHEELLSKNGLYAKLWQRQSGGFLGQDD